MFLLQIVSIYLFPYPPTRSKSHFQIMSILSLVKQDLIELEAISLYFV